MEKMYKTHGVVLKKKKWRGDDLFFLIFTEDFGLIEAVAVGARKIKSKLNGHLSLPGIVELIFVRGRNFYKVTHAYSVENWALNDEQDLCHLSAFSEVMIAAMAREVPNKTLWEALIWSLRGALRERSAGEKRFVVNLFLLKLLTEAGYKIKTESCAVCGREITVGAGFDFAHPGFVCGTCHKGQPFGAKIFELIKKLQLREEVRDVSISKSDNEQLFSLLKKYLSFSFEKKLGSLDYLK